MAVVVKNDNEQITNLGEYWSDLHYIPLDLTCNDSNVHEDQQQVAQIYDGTAQD